MKDIVIKELVKVTKLGDQDIEFLLETPPSPDLGDFAFPCFFLAKQMKKNPIEIARELSEKIKSEKFEKVEAAGPYVNFFIDRGEISKSILSEILAKKDSFGRRKVKERVAIEFPSPNTNKPLHIGHARNIILGQSISKILEFMGGEIKILNLNNDRGIHICKSMVAYEKFGNDLTPEKAKRPPAHFVGDMYVKFAKELEKNPNLEEEAKSLLIKWENGDKKTRDLWKKMNSWAYSGFNNTYKKFDLKIDKNYYESDIYDKGKDLIKEGLKKGVFLKKKDGAIYVDLSSNGLGEKILLRADGTSIYITQDLYLAKLKKKEFDYDRSIYITASEQDYHFKALFTILSKLEYKWADNLRHLSYGMVNLESGRMKSREGNVVDADDFIDHLVGLVLEDLKKRHGDLSQKELKNRSTAIAMAAMRYYFLKVDRIKDITFRPEESINFEGNTGPYLLYTYARAKSILKKSNKKSKISKAEITDLEKELIILLSKFPDVVFQAFSTLSPSVIANYSYEISKKFNEYYHEEQIIGSKDENFKLALVEALSIVLKNSLHLLQIDVLEQM